MPTEKECSELKVAQASIDSRVDAIGERLDEVLEELRSIKQWAAKYGTICFLLLIAGDKALPVITKMLGVPA